MCTKLSKQELQSRVVVVVVVVVGTGQDLALPSMKEIDKKMTVIKIQAPLIFNIILATLPAFQSVLLNFGSHTPHFIQCAHLN